MFSKCRALCSGYIVLITLFSFSIQMVSYAQLARNSEQIEEKIRQQILQIEAEKDKLAPNERKVTSNIRNFVKALEADKKSGTLSAKSTAKKYEKSAARINDKFQVQLSVTLLQGKDSDSAFVKNWINNNGGYVRLITKSTGSYPLEIYCWLQYDKISELSKISSIGNISEFGEAILRVGPKCTQGDQQLKADKARRFFNTTGSGIKVGVISDGVCNINTSINAGELPSINNSTHILYAGNTEKNEGTAMMEIIHDIAPNADLYFAGCKKTDGPGDIALRIGELNSAGCQIIVEDIGWLYLDPQFSDGVLYNAISTFQSTGTKYYISAAGNEGLKCWYGTFFPDATRYHLWYNQNGTYDDSNTFTPQIDKEVSVILQWADKWDYALSDYDLYVTDRFGTAVGSSTSTQGGAGTIPREQVTFTYTAENYFPPFYVKVKQKSTSSEPNKELRLIITDGDLLYKYQNFPTNPGKPNHQICGKDMASAITVGAYPQDNENVLETFSSRGPSIFCTFSSTGVRTGTNPRNTPTIIATDYVETNAVGFTAFSGTSASAPHIAGIAALYFAKNSTGNFLNDLKLSAASIAGGTGGTYNDQSGYGKADAAECLTQPLTAIPAGTIPANTNWSNRKILKDITVTIASNVVVTIPASTVTIVKGNVNFGNANSKITVSAGGRLVIRDGANIDATHINGTVGTDVIFEGGVTVQQVDASGALLPTTFQFSRWENGTFQPYDNPKTFIDIVNGSTRVFRANQVLQSNNKYFRWKIGDGEASTNLNHQPFLIATTPVTLSAEFNQTNDVTIQARFVEGGDPGGSVEFMDPWLIDFADASYGNNVRNQGMSAPFKTVNYASNNLGLTTSYKGVFLGRLTSDPNYYSVRALLQNSNLNGFTGYFQNWSYTNSGLFQNVTSPSGYDQKAVIFYSSGAVVTANYKAHLGSSVLSATESGNQRKIVKDGNGKLHLVYVSLNKVYYSSSTDNGATWSVDLQISGSGTASTPSIATSGGWDDEVYFTWQEIQGSTKTVYVKSLNSISTPLGLDTENSSVDMQPVISVSAEGDKVLVIYKKNYSGRYQIHYKYSSNYGSTFSAGGPVSISIPIIGNSPSVAWNNQSSKFMVSTATKTTTVTVDLMSFDGSTWAGEGNAYYSNQVPNAPTFSQAAVDGAGRTHVTWIGYDNQYQQNSAAMHRSYLNGVWSSVRILRDEVLYEPPIIYTSICGHNDSDGGVSVFYTSGSLQTLFDVYSTDNTNWNGLGYISPSAAISYPGTLVNSSPQSISLVAAKGSSAPYRIVHGLRNDSQAGTSSGTLKQSAGKESNEFKLYRRVELTDTVKNCTLSIQFGNISGKTVQFADFKQNFSKELQTQFLSTVPVEFEKNDTVKVEFKISGNNWKRNTQIIIELVDASSGKTISKLNDYNFANIKTELFSVNNTKEIINPTQNKNAFIRIRIDENDYSNIVLQNMDVMVLNTDKAANKSSQKAEQISLTPAEYNLEQNYPNPFNPTTVISFQTPNPGKVSLKVFDILGKEIATLVDGYLEAGTHNIKFNASNLVSGVYIYKITADNFTQSRKMILTK